MTLGKLNDLYIERRIVGRLRSAPNVVRILRRTLEPLAGMHAADVRRRDLAPLLEKIAARGHERSAGKTRTLIGGLFKWAETQGIVDVDPTRGLPVYDQGTPRDRVLDFDGIRCCGHGSTIFRRNGGRLACAIVDRRAHWRDRRHTDW